MDAPEVQIREGKGAFPSGKAGFLVEEFVAIAEIVRPQGIRGEVKVRLLCDEADYLTQCAQMCALWMEESSRNDFSRVELEVVRSQGEFAIVRIENVRSRNDVEPLRGRRIGLSQNELPRPEKGSFYHFQLEGMTVVESDGGAELGLVERVVQNPAHDQLVVVPPNPGAKTFMIPMVEVFIRHIDPHLRRIEVELPKGLIESQQ